MSKLLGEEPDTPDDEDEDDAEEETPPQVGRPPQGASDFKNFTDAEVTSLRRCLELLRQGGSNDPKLEALIGYLRGTHPGVTRSWLDLGCILFSQYYDTVRWIGDELARRAEFSGMEIGLYAGSNRSGVWREGRFQRCGREVLKARVRAGELKLLLGTDAASEGLNLQRLGTLINIDLPWNPTRLEQRKGRIQRIGQARSEIWIANLRYRDSVEDRSIRCWPTGWNPSINSSARSLTPWKMSGSRLRWMRNRKPGSSLTGPRLPAIRLMRNIAGLRMPTGKAALWFSTLWR
jgi:hypothetical protein